MSRAYCSAQNSYLAPLQLLTRTLSSAEASFSAPYARRLFSGHTALFLDIPFAAAPSLKVDSTQQNAIASLATLFVTPSLRVRFAGQVLVSPWLSGGFGYGHYEGSRISTTLSPT
jgi:hypothetical protein